MVAVAVFREGAKMMKVKKILISKSSDLLDQDTNYYPEDLRRIADEMVKQNIAAVRVSVNYDRYFQCFQEAYETDSELALRVEKTKLAKEFRKRENEEHKEKIRKEAIKLGLLEKPTK